ncbi:MAG: M43 family zinc metalloprotease, partial [Bacteroidota bacterium]
MGEKVRTARNAGLYDENNRTYQSFVKKAREAYDQREALKTDDDCPNGIVVIPIAFHIFHESGAAIGTQHNFSLVELNELVGSLNADFGGYNTNKEQILECFQDVDAYNTCIQYCIGKINRIDITTCSACPGGANCDENALFNCSQDAPNDYLNIYSAQFGGGLLGVASSIPFPGNPFGACIENNDGVYVDWNSFNVGPPANAPYDGGKTLTHEIGHWLGLYHIGGDGNCNADDGLADTPVQNGQNMGCPVGANSCNTAGADKPDMYFNHMDYSNDACLAMFTKDQAAIMQAVLGYGNISGIPAPAGCRAMLASSSQRGNCDNSLLSLDNSPLAANTETINLTDCSTESSIDLL